ncbi:MAG: hypothetical protein WBB43_02130 [Limnoraphis sp.]
MDDFFNDNSQSLLNEVSSWDFSDSLFNTNTSFSSEDSSRDSRSSDTPSENNIFSNETSDENSNKNSDTDNLILPDSDLNFSNTNVRAENDNSIPPINFSNSTSNQYFSSVTIAISYNTSPTISFGEEVQDDPLTGEPLTEPFLKTDNINDYDPSFFDSSGSESISDLNSIGSELNDHLHNNFNEVNYSFPLNIDESYPDHFSPVVIINVTLPELEEMPDPTTSSNGESITKTEEEVSESENPPANVTTNNTLKPAYPSNVISQKTIQIISQVKELSLQFIQKEDTTNNSLSIDSGHAGIDNLSGMKELGSLNC